MIMVRLMGGLGNQMFQYSFGRYLAEEHNTLLRLDPTLLLTGNDDPNKVKRDYSLDIFNIKAEIGSKEEIEWFNPIPEENSVKRVLRKVNPFKSKGSVVVQHFHHFLPEHLNLPDDTCIVGNWQSERYFSKISEKIRSDFQLLEPLNTKDEELANRIKESNSICLNVRRADYVNHPEYSTKIGALPIEFYDKAVSFLRTEVKDPILYIFSDEVEWCMENLHYDLPMVFVGHEYKGRRFGKYLSLMSMCKHFIIPNSTFGWWAAWLSENDNKKVILPEKWALHEDYFPTYIFPEDWIKF